MPYKNFITPPTPPPPNQQVQVFPPPHQLYTCRETDSCITAQHNHPNKPLDSTGNKKKEKVEWIYLKQELESLYNPCKKGRHWIELLFPE